MYKGPEKTGQILDKSGNPIYMSGIPDLAWPDFVPFLLQAGVSQEILNKMTWDNQINIFKLQCLELQRTNRQIKSHANEYAFNPWEKYKSA